MHPLPLRKFTALWEGGRDFCDLVGDMGATGSGETAIKPPPHLVVDHEATHQWPNCGEHLFPSVRPGWGVERDGIVPDRSIVQSIGPRGMEQ